MNYKHDDILSIGQAATLLGVKEQTVRNWEKLGKVKPFRTPGGHRRYRYADLIKVMPAAKYIEYLKETLRGILAE